MKKTKLQNVQSLEAVDSISIMSAMESGFLGSGDMGSGAIPYPTGIISFSYPASGNLEGVGDAGYTISGRYSINNYNLTVEAFVTRKPDFNCTYSASVMVITKTNSTSAKLQQQSGAQPSDKGIPLGRATIAVPKYGVVKVKLRTIETVETDLVPIDVPCLYTIYPRHN